MRFFANATNQPAQGLLQATRAIGGGLTIAVVHSATAGFEKPAGNVGPGAKALRADTVVDYLPIKFGTTDLQSCCA